MTDRVRIALFDLFSVGGGAPVVAGRLVKGLLTIPHGPEVVLIDPFGDLLELLQLDCPLRATLVHLAVDRRLRALSRSSLTARLLALLKVPIYGVRLGRLLRSLGVDVVVFNLWKSGVVAWVGARVCGARLVFYSHGVQSLRDINAVYKFLLREADVVIAVSQGTVEQLVSAGISPEKVRLVYNSVELPQSPSFDGEEIRSKAGIPPDAFVFGCVGNVIRRKGIDVLVRAFSAFHKMNGYKEGTYLVVVGHDPGEDNWAYRAQVESIIDEGRIRGQVRFLGFRRDVNALLHMFNVFVMPSRMESFGVAMVEAMSVGLPVIATASGSIPEIVRDRVTGLLVPPEDPMAMARAMWELYTAPELRRALGAAAAEDVRRRFTVQQQALAFLDAIAGILAPGKRAVGQSFSDDHV